MRVRHLAPRAFLLVTVTLCVALPAGADAENPAGEDRGIVVVADDGARVSVEFRNGELSIVREEDGRTSVSAVDVEQIGRLVADGIEDAIAALRDAQLDLHVGVDNRIEISHGGETVEVDVDAILAEVGAALEQGFAALEDDGWVETRDRDRTEAELRRELRDLKREMRELRRELERISR
jgi:hypothetical protein